MFFSKITYSPHHLEKIARQLRGDLFREHQMIWCLFDNQPDTERDFLYRREDAPRKLPLYYLLSDRKPKNKRIELDVQTKEFKPMLRDGDHLAFNLRANAVVTRKTDNNDKRRIRRDIIEAKVDEYKKQYPSAKDRPRPSVIHQEAAEAWLNRQGEQSGFSVTDLFVENHQFHKVKKPKDPNLRHFTSLDFNGCLQVLDSEVFLEKVFYRRDSKTERYIAGLGRSKAFGCGLMLIRRL